VLFLAENFELEDFNMIDTNAKRVLEALADFSRGEFVKGFQIHAKTGLTPETINHAVRALEKSLLIDNPTTADKLPPYEFYAVEITDFGRQVLQKFG
jgi:hypothetical protein